MSDAPPVELIERGPFEVADSVTSEEPMQRGPVVGTKALVVLSIGLIVLAFAVMTRPGPEDRVVEEPPQTTAPPATTAPPPVEAETEADQPQALDPIPRFESNLPAELPGVLSGIDDRGSLVVVDRSRGRPDETSMELVPEPNLPNTVLSAYGGEPVGIAVDVLVRGNLLVVDNDDTIVADTFNLSRLAPDQEGGVLLVETERGSSKATWTQLGPGASGSSAIVWTLPSPSIEVAGVWGEELVVHRANRTWLLASNGDTRPVGEGLLLAYDGQHLARLVCDRLGVCSLALGTPDDPDARTLALPDWLEQGPDSLWAPTVAISPDGKRLAMAGPNGGISSPLIVDLETGVVTPLADGINRQADVAWSPDGRWLAYLYTDDVMVWNLDERRSWRITLDRQLQSLMWR